MYHISAQTHTHTPLKSKVYFESIHLKNATHMNFLCDIQNDKSHSNFIYSPSMCQCYSLKFVCCFIYCSCRILRTSANILVINLAISDFFMLAKTPIYIYNSINCGPALGDFGKIFSLLNVLLF